MNRKMNYSIYRQFLIGRVAIYNIVQKIVKGDGVSVCTVMALSETLMDRSE